jgi:hypothetical protein
VSLGPRPSVGSRAKDPRQGLKDCIPLKLTTFYIMKRKFLNQILTFRTFKLIFMNEHLTKQCANSPGMDKNMSAFVTDIRPASRKFLHSWLADRLSAEIRRAQFFRLNFGS